MIKLVKFQEKTVLIFIYLDCFEATNIGFVQGKQFIRSPYSTFGAKKVGRAQALIHIPQK